MSPLSQESNLRDLRDQLREKNELFFSTLSERKLIGQKIQDLKSERVGQYSHYCPRREKEIFGEMKNSLALLSLRELLAFSLIMEEHADSSVRGGNCYPIWSSQIHLLKKEEEIFFLINPLLLKLLHQHLFFRLQLKSDFTFLTEL